MLGVLTAIVLTAGCIHTAMDLPERERLAAEAANAGAVRVCVAPESTRGSVPTAVVKAEQKMTR